MRVRGWLAAGYPPRDVHHTGADRLLTAVEHPGTLRTRLTYYRARAVRDRKDQLHAPVVPPAPPAEPRPPSAAAATTALLAAGVLAGCSGDDGPQRTVDAFLAGWRSGDLQTVGVIDPLGTKIPSADVAREIKELSGELAATRPR
ncbi:hypothetical protein NKG94_43430 [Micromonospora sp. M12]